MERERGLKVGRRKLALVLMMPMLLVGFYVLADTYTFPTMTVVGHRPDGGALVCSTGACFDTAQEESARAYMEFLRMYDRIPQEAPAMDGERFCQSLASKQPQNCSLSQPPASPGIPVPGRAAWQPNGCGTGGVGGWFQDWILERIASDSYSGDLNAPYPGVSFRSACDGHDQCWAAGGARGACDDAFNVDMDNACNQLSAGGGRSTCTGFSSLYHGAVSVTDPSDSAYATSTAKRVCAVWAYEMRENDCG